MKKNYLKWSTILMVIAILQNITFQSIAQKSNPFNKKKATTEKSIQFNHGLPLIINGADNFSSSNVYKSIPALNTVLLNQKTSNVVLKVSYDKNQKVNFIWLQENKKYFAEQNAHSFENISKTFFNENKTLWLSENQNADWALKNIETDNLNMTHLKFNQTYLGLKIWNAEVITHFKNDQLESINGKMIACSSINIHPTINSNSALEIAYSNLKITNHTELFKGFDNTLKNLLQPTVELIIYQDEDLKVNPTLAYRVSVYKNTIEHWELFINANSGHVIYQSNITCADGPTTANALDLNNANKTINTYLKTGTHYLLDASRVMFAGGAIPDDAKGAIITFDQKNIANSQNLFYITSVNNTWTDKASVSAHFNGGQAYEYYRTVHNRNSLDGKGGNIYSIVNVPEQDGTSMENAFWNGQFMLYGNGGNSMKPLAGGLDVAAHEMTHGVIENSANLEYKFQSGAINESMADIFGAMVDRDDWKLGEDIVKLNAFPSGALRDLSNPHNGGTSINDQGWQPAHMNEFLQLNENQDHGGVHINSGIVNKAYYLFATAITKEKAEKIYYRALTLYLTRSSNFVDLRLAVIKSANDLHGPNSTEAIQAASAFDGVGIGGSGGTGGTVGTLTTNPGTEFLLAHDATAVGVDPNSLYIVSNPTNPQAGDFHPIATLNALNKASISDNGASAFFVAENLKPYELTLSINNPILSELDNSPDWNNIAVSKDGNRIALISNYIDTAIYVYDFNLQLMAKYHLYNPTTGAGQNTDGPLYANAIEWDYTGNYLIYDAYNLYKKSNGDTLDYWDVGIIKVWDKQQNYFADGSITKLFSALSEGVSIGNPSISKNSPNIIAFDYFDSNNNTFLVVASNIETGDAGTIYQNNTLGYPSYNKLDNVIDFSFYDQGTNSINIATIGLQTNKIQPLGQAAALISGGQWPIFYATGTRNINLGNGQLKMDQNSLTAYPNPFNDQINFNFNLNEDANVQLQIKNSFGQLVDQHTAGFLNKGKQTINVETNQLPQGIYFAILTINGANFVQKIIK